MSEQFDEDEISKWAQSLTPDGTPGAVDSVFRSLFGDKDYEAYKQRGDRLAELQVKRTEIINQILATCLIFLVVATALFPITLLYLVFS